MGWNGVQWAVNEWDGLGQFEILNYLAVYMFTEKGLFI